MKRLFTFLKRTVMLFLFLGVTLSTKAQNKISGKVKDASDGSTVTGATVVVKGTTTGTITDIEGDYSFSVPSDAETLVVSFIGYKSKEVIIGGRSQIDIQLEIDIEELEEVVVVGYGIQKKKEVTGAVASLKADELLKNATPDLGDAIQGQVAGVNVQASSGRPGEVANIQIRGLGSVAEGASGPLYVVDGIPYQDNPRIANEQIESIEVLKDGAAAAIYGVRASNGVILITTRRGKAGQMKVDFSAYAGIQNITSGTPLLNTQDQFYVNHEKLKPLNQEPQALFFNPDALSINNDFVGDIQNDNALMQSYNLNLMGGEKNLTFNANVNYFDQEGVLINSDYDRITTRVNGTYTKGKFKAFASMSFSEEQQSQEPWQIYEQAVVQMPYNPGINALDPLGNDEFFIISDNVEQYSYLSQIINNRDERTINTNNVALNLEYEFFEGFSYKVNLGRNDWNYRRKFFEPKMLVFGPNSVSGSGRTQAVLTEEFVFNKKTTWENILNYQKKFGVHNLGVTGVLAYEAFDSKDVTTKVNGLASNNTQVFDAGISPEKPLGSNSSRNLAGKMLRVQYGYDERYLLSASIRHDGTSVFSKDNRYQSFFGLSAGWNISEESFFQNISELNFINSLKIRGSYAQVGNQSTDGAYDWQPIIETGVNYPFGGEGEEVLGIGSIQRRYYNPLIGWETTISRNIGVDMAFLENRVTFTMDFYNNDKEDMILPEQVAPSSGVWQTRDADSYNRQTVNAGNMVNKGVELALGYRESSSEFKWSINATFTKNTNEVTNLNGIEGLAFAGGRPVASRGDRVDYTTYLVQGYEAGAFFLVKNQGVIKTEEQLEKYQAGMKETYMIGDLMYEDQLTIDTDGDGIMDARDSVITDADRVYRGSGMPEFELGLAFNAQYKGFDLFVQAYYSYGAEIYNGSKLHAYGTSRHRDMLYMWTPSNPDSDIPMARNNQEHSNFRGRSDYYLEDGSYLRIRNITLGYTFPSKVFNDRISKLRLYFTAQNPFTFTKYEGYDPEVGGDGLFTRGVDSGSYPITRKFLGGIQLQF
ncbi:SusC/RagA family TonB-linked outer membrane protein [Reichenbachiella versicolor]|uniref:SusC/RagA family TonB-linked outer membrane protein n=1 Tax=Reichenbachiella versicolor TaxID=1821036 RepID=UPI000D6DD414|nr:SusC/RagA family TonB-linked outer membrane protein [Reichenbachiella versicolor]